MDSDPKISLQENFEIKVKDKPKNKIYSTNFLGQFMIKSLENELKTGEENQGKNCYYNKLFKISFYK